MRSPLPRTWRGQDIGLPAFGPDSLADPWQRLGARLIDGLLFLPLYIVPFVVNIVQNIDDPESISSFELPFQWWVFSLIGLAYEVILVATRGQTVGKMALGIKVVRKDTGELPGWGPAFLRWVIPGALGFLFPLVILDQLWLLWDRHRQCLHDKLARTLVVRTR